MKVSASAILFDFDGTLADSAPDLADAANEMRLARGLEPLPFQALRPAVGSGARGMLGTAFGVHTGQAEFELMRDEFLNRYEQRMLLKTRLFDAVALMLDGLEQRGLRWGIVTNKAQRFAGPMTRSLGLVPRTSVLVCGDSTPYTKPHPAPLLEGARLLGTAPPSCIYVGDDERDVHAGRAAGMGTLAAAWGYLGHGAVIEGWGADAVLVSPMALLQCLDMT